MELKNTDLTAFSAAAASQRSAGESASSAKKVASSSAYPPMSSKAPRPFPSSSAAKSQATSSSVATETQAKKSATKSPAGSSAYPPQSKVAPKPFSSSQPSPADQGKAKPPLPEKEKGASSLGFGSMAGLAASLNTSEGNQNAADDNVTTSPDYRAALASIYQKAGKVADVDKILAKYKGKEMAVIEKVANKYSIPNPLAGSSFQTEMGAAPAPSSSSSPSAFGNSGPAAPAPATSPFAPSKNPSPFGAAGGLNTASSATNPSPFSSSGSSGGGSGFQTKSPSPFGQSNATTPISASPSVPAPAFGSATPSQQPGFGSTNNATPGFGSSTQANTPFGSQAGSFASASPFGSPATAPANSERRFKGMTARELLTQFYQFKAPEKLSKIDDNLTKYKGREEHMFQILANKVCRNVQICFVPVCI
ncbi:MAG: hypothetical protein SGARI_000344 [Bacillariaceae sp.]